MPATVTTQETFDSDVSRGQMDEEVKLRLKAGAIRSTHKKNDDGSWTLTTEWNVIGEQ